eukprot:gene5979-1065_t
MRFARLRTAVRDWPAAHEPRLAMLTDSTKTSVHAMLSQVSLDNALGVDRSAKDNTLLGFLQAYGVDAILLVEYAGLRPMGQRLQAGTPAVNVQATINSLLEVGLSVAVYEEVGPVKARGIKDRSLAQVVTPANPVYAWGCTPLKGADLCIPESRPYIGLASGTTGPTWEHTLPLAAVGCCMAACTLNAHTTSFTIVEVQVDMRTYTQPTVQVRSNLTQDAMATVLGIGAFSTPVYIHNMPSSSLPISSTSTQPIQLPGPSGFPEAVVQAVARDMSLPPSEALSFREVVHSSENRVRPLHYNTATQLGLVPAPGIPSLATSILPAKHWAISARLLQRWLLQPPPHEVTLHIRTTLNWLCSRGGPEVGGAVPLPVPASTPAWLGQTLTLILNATASASLYTALLEQCEGVIAMLTGPGCGAVLPDLAAVVEYESGLHCDPAILLAAAQRFAQVLQSFIPVEGSEPPQQVLLDPKGNIPDEFFQRTQAFWGSLRVVKFQAQVNALVDATRHLCETVDHELDTDKIGVDLLDLSVYCRVKPSQDAGGEVEVYHDRKGRPTRKFTTAGVKAAVAGYLLAAEAAEAEVSTVLRELSVKVAEDHLAVVQICWHWICILSTLHAHAGLSLSQKWCAPAQEPPSSVGGALVLTGAWPYWIPPSSRVPNDFLVEGTNLLCAPNMSGKSTAIRTILSCSLLSLAGLNVPAASASVPWYDGVFMRCPSQDAPADGKSAFAVEMDELAAILRDCGGSSLVLLDEIGRGTSSRSATSISGAVMEHLASAGATALVASHLHELYSMPLRCKVSDWKMEVETLPGGTLAWVYRMAPGTCTDSLALVVGEMFGLPAAVLDRACELEELFPVASDVPQAPTVLEQDAFSGGRTRAVAGVQAALDVYVSATALPGLSPSCLLLALAGSVLEQLAGSPHGRPQYVPQDCQPPPALAQHSCVYVGCSLDGWFYVGETDDLLTRITTH